MKYRSEIDGLRALAVVPVILFHAGFEVFSGGFVGVDVFFVISGYLITTMLIDEIENNRFCIVNFYERRARRILPALFFVMLLCIPFAWIWMLPSEIKDFSESLIAVNLFSSNMLFWAESGYFAAAAEEKPLLHTWSLAVEEQYYVLFPIFLLLAWRFGRNKVFWMIVVFAAMSLALSEWGWRNSPTANFYFAPTRAWELFAGSIAAFIVQKRGVKANNTLSLFGLLAIVFAIFAYDENTPFPSLYALVPVLGVVFLILFAGKDTLAAKLLSTKIFVGIGLISYSAYLWHQPLFAFARIRLLEAPSEFVMATLSIISIILAYFSWKLIETPFRNKQVIKRKPLLVFSGLVGSLFIVVGLFGHFLADKQEEYWIFQQPASIQKTYRLVTEKSPELNSYGMDSERKQSFSKCRFNVRELTVELEERFKSCQSEFGSGFLILGDSHAIDLFGAVASRFVSPFLIGITKPGCRPHHNFEYCHYDRVKIFLEKNPNTFKKIIYEEAGFHLLQKDDGSAGSREMFSELPLNAEVKGIVPNHDDIRGTLEYLTEIAEHAKVVWFLPRAEPQIRARQILKQGCDADYHYRVNQYETFTKLDFAISEMIESLHNPNVIAVSQNELFQFDLAKDFINCDAVYWSDGDHLSADGEVRFGSRLPNSFLD